MSLSTDVKHSLSAALPIMAGYVGIGIPCGILECQVGFDPLMAFMMSILFYSGAGQFMIPGMWMAGQSFVSIIASVSFVNTRQTLYSAAFAQYFTHARKLLTFFFSATVTDESFGVNLERFVEGNWTPLRALFVNVFCMLTWAVSNAIGVIVAGALSIPTAIAAFAMTSIFICLLVMQKMNKTNVIVIVASMLGVFVCKLVGLTGPAILLGACFGVVVGAATKVVKSA